VILKNVEIRRCPNCGEEEVVIPALRKLHQTVAHVLIENPSRLNGEEIRFLRTHLNWTSADLAANFGVDKATVSRWENDKAQMSAQADRLLRLAVAHNEPEWPYPLKKLSEIGKQNHIPLLLKMRTRKNSWVADRHAG
jgi:putative zinc finger/helix-turn-helix YgiT family protein